MKRTGEASILIELADGYVTVYHGTDGDELRHFKANENSWKLIWTGINNAEEISKLNSQII